MTLSATFVRLIGLTAAASWHERRCHHEEAMLTT
jgi:hypothetical protein